MPAKTKVWQLVIIGRGSSAAYYVSSLDLSKVPEILCIGEQDAWSEEVRGHAGEEQDPTLLINHPMHLIKHFDDDAPQYGTELVDRLKWAEQNAGVFTRCKVKIVDATVLKVSQVKSLHSAPEELNSVPGYKILVKSKDPNKNNKIYYAHKVVMATGTGAHRVPASKDACHGVRKARKSGKVLNLDEAAKLSDLKDKRIIVLGPNAAIDGVHKGLAYQRCTISWLLKDGENPPVLATQPMVKKAFGQNPRFKPTPRPAAGGSPAASSGAASSSSSSSAASSAASSSGAASSGNKPTAEEVQQLKDNVQRDLRDATEGDVKYNSETGHNPRHEIYRFTELRVSASAAEVSVTIKGPSGKQTLVGDYLIYGIGPDGDPLKKIDEEVKERLTPILDKNQYLGAGPDTILGWQAPGTGLTSGFEVIGSLATQVGRDLVGDDVKAAAYLQRYKDDVQKVRTVDVVRGALVADDAPRTSLLDDKLEDLAKMDRGLLGQQLQKEVETLLRARDESQNAKLRAWLDLLASLILAYHAAANLDKKSVRDRMNQQGRTFPAVADAGQLTPIKAATAAINDKVPAYLGEQKITGGRGMMEAGTGKMAELTFTTKVGDVNFSTDSGTAIHIYISLKYPCIPEWKANVFVDELMRLRPKTGIGFSPQTVESFHKQLARWNREAIAKLHAQKPD